MGSEVILRYIVSQRPRWAIDSLSQNRETSKQSYVESERLLSVLAGPPMSAL